MRNDSDFGRVLTAMVTPFTVDGKLDRDGAQVLAGRLTEDGHNDGLVVNGTTGESATTSDREKNDLVRAVVEVVGGRARVIAGVGSSDTRHSIELARGAAENGADGLLVVTPYYSRPSQEGILAHFRAIADSTPLPVMLYDIPHRTGVPIEPATMLRAAEHVRIRAVKDAKGDLAATSRVISESGLSFYSGDDALNLPLLSVGAVGFVSVVGHVVADRLRAMLVAHRSGAADEALRIHQRLLPIYEGMFRAPAAALAKAAMDALGLPGGPVRSPLAGATPHQREVLLADMRAAGVSVAATARSR